jgi:hypothetical protein
MKTLVRSWPYVNLPVWHNGMGIQTPMYSCCHVLFVVFHVWELRGAPIYHGFISDLMSYSYQRGTSPRCVYPTVFMSIKPCDFCPRKQKTTASSRNLHPHTIHPQREWVPPVWLHFFVHNQSLSPLIWNLNRSFTIWRLLPDRT